MRSPGHRNVKLLTSGEPSSASDEPTRRMSPLDAFERMFVELIQLEAVANAANVAIDEYGVPPSGTRRDFDRAHALVSRTAESADALLALARELKDLLGRERGKG